RVVERAREDGRADLVEAVLELGDDAEVAAAASQPPQQVVVGGDDRAVGDHDLGADQVVDGRAAAAHQPADAPAQREARGPGVGGPPARPPPPPPPRAVPPTPPHGPPPGAGAVSAGGSPAPRRIGDRSITSPSSRIACPATPCPPPRTEIGSSRSRAS